MLNLRLLQLAGDFWSAGYSLEEPGIFGWRKSSPIEYIIVHQSTGLLTGRLFQARPWAPINYEVFPYGDIEGKYYSKQAHVIFEERNRLIC